jgi:hypothetical protein
MNRDINELGIQTSLPKKQAVPLELHPIVQNRFVKI